MDLMSAPCALAGMENYQELHEKPEQSGDEMMEVYVWSRSSYGRRASSWEVVTSPSLVAAVGRLRGRRTVIWRGDHSSCVRLGFDKITVL